MKSWLYIASVFVLSMVVLSLTLDRLVEDVWFNQNWPAILDFLDRYDGLLALVAALLIVAVTAWQNSKR